MTANEARELSNNPKPDLDLVFKKIKEQAVKGFNYIVLTGLTLSTNQVLELERLGYTIDYGFAGATLIHW